MAYVVVSTANLRSIIVAVVYVVGAAQYETGVVVPEILHYLIYGSIRVRIVIVALGAIALRPS